MKSFTLSAAVLAAGVSAQYSASTPAAAMSYAASSMSAASMPAASMAAPSVTTTITAKAGCPTGPAPDVMVTRSDVPVPSCAAGSNSTKPSIISMPGYGPPAGQTGSASGAAGAGGKGNATMTGMPPQFTGAASMNVASGVLAVVAGLAAWAL